MYTRVFLYFFVHVQIINCHHGSSRIANIEAQHGEGARTWVKIDMRGRAGADLGFREGGVGVKIGA